MNFYTTIHQYYDQIFPLNSQQISFIKDEFERGSKILDMGCSTGELAAILAKNHYQVDAIDLDEKMIDLAKSRNNSNNPVFRVANMMDVSQIYYASQFDGVYCFGNTLAHLLEDQQFETLFKSIHQLLDKNGKFVFQILNYDYILNEKITSLPLIKNEQIEFIRNYSFLENGLINFNTNLKIFENGQVIENNISLNPITRTKITQFLIQTSFNDIQFFGGFNRTAIKQDSLPLIVVAAKG